MNNTREWRYTPLQWHNITGFPARSGFYTVTNLEPGWRYQLEMAFANPSNGNRVERRTRYAQLLPGHTRFATRDLVFYFEPQDVALNRISHSNLWTWINRMQIAHDDLYHLTGRRPWRGRPMEIRSTRHDIDPRYAAVAGHPIRVSHQSAIDIIGGIEVHGCWTFLILHELSHNFDISYHGGVRYGASWNFHGEFFANFKMAYVMYRSNAEFISSTHRRIDFAAYRNYFQTTHDSYIGNNRFHHDALVHSFLRIQSQIGWEPFRRTFRYFNALAPANAPQLALPRFELFINRLSHYSGVNVVNLFTQQERNVYWEHFRRRV